MRILLPALLIAASLPVPCEAATRNFGITSFDRIRIEGPYKVLLATGIAPFAKASGAPAALDRVSVSVQGRTLVVRGNEAWGGYPGQDLGPVEVSLGTHDLSEAFLNGSGTLQVDKVKGLSFRLSVEGSGAAAIGRVDVDQLNTGVAGTANALLAGRAGKLTASVRGISALQAEQLATKYATIGVNGAGTVKAQVTNSARIDASGPATVSLSGEPSCTVKLTGSASVSGCKAPR